MPLTGRPQRCSIDVGCSGLCCNSERPAGRCHDVTDDSGEGVDTFSAAVRSERVDCPRPISDRDWILIPDDGDFDEPTEQLDLAPEDLVHGSRVDLGAIRDSG